MVTNLAKTTIILFIAPAILLKGMNPDADKKLSVAISRLDATKVQDTLNAYADPNAGYYFEESHQLLYAVANVHNTLLVRRKFKNNTIAIQNARLEIARLLLNAGANPESKENNFEWTALHLAAYEGQTDLVELLIKKGADPNASLPEKEGKDTPLILATIRGHTSTVRTLLAKGANPTYTNRDKRAALHYAQENNYNEIIKVLQN